MPEKEPTVLITFPGIDDPGGISNYISNIKNRMSIRAVYGQVGRRYGERGLLKNIYRLIKDNVAILKILSDDKIDIAHINLSLNLKGVMRDGLLIVFSRFHRKRILVFFHGWEKLFEEKLGRYFLWLFKWIFNSADAFIVLADDFKKRLRGWGFRQPIYIENMLVDDDLIKDFDLAGNIEKRLGQPGKSILFLSRILAEKGIYETVDAVALLQEKYPGTNLVVAGDGEELGHLRALIIEKNILHIRLAGYLKGVDKRNAFENSFAYCLPSYEEGMPISLLEAMCFGLPVITTAVGGISDIFVDGKNGFIVGKKDPSMIASSIEKLIHNQETYREMSFHNYRFSHANFMASQGAKRLESIYGNILKNGF